MADTPAPAVHLQRIDPAYLDQTAAEGMLFAVADGCVVPDLDVLARELGPERVACLYLGQAAENYADKAPYLLRVDADLLAMLRARFADEAWGCLFTSSESWDRIRRHLRSLLSVSSPEGERWLFRFWDPRLLPAFLRASEPDELNAFFGPIATFAVIEPDGVAYGAWRHLAVTDTPPRRPVGGRYRISPAQVAALRREGVTIQLERSFEGAARASPEGDAVLVRTPGDGTMRLSLGGGLVDGVTSPMGRHWSLRNREDGKLAELVTPSGSALALDYDRAGQLERVSRDGEERFRAAYDGYGRQTRLAFPDGTTFDTHYLLEGSAALADPDGTLVAAQRDRLGRVERFGYDDGRLAAAEDGGGNVTRFAYGETDRPDATLFADGTRETYRYDPAGNLAALVRADGAGLEVACNPAGKPVRIAAADGAEARFGYDDAGRLVAAENAEIALAWRYDDAGRLVEEQQGDAVIRHHHDDSGHIATTYPGGETVHWRRDPDQRLAELTDWTGGRYAMAYADADAGWRMVGPDGVVSANWQDRAGHPAAVRVEGPAGLLWETAYARDGEDRLRECRDSRIGSAAYSYDAEGQILAVARSAGPAEQFAYDGAGNRIASPAGAATFDACNRLLAQGPTIFRYDARGATSERIGPDGAWRFTYDGFDRLVRAEDDRGRNLTFGYDPLGRRIWKRASEGTQTTLTRFVWAGEQIVREVIERDGAAPAVRDYLYWPHSHTPLLLRENGAVYRYHVDPLGVPVRLTAAGGRIVWEADREAFGRAHELVRDVAQPLRLPGQYADDEFGLGLHYNRFRYYDPAIGRYISRDPIGVAGGLNQYLYVGNDPIHQADPLGLWWKTALTVLGAAAAVVVVVVAAPVVLPMLGVAAGSMLAAGITTVAAGAAAGAVGMGLNEALNQEKFCGSCIALAALKGAGIGAVAALPFAFLPATAGVAAFAGVGAGSGLIGYAGDVLLNGHPWSWRDAAIAMAIGAGTAGLGRYVAGRLAAPSAKPAAPPAATSGAKMTMAEAVGGAQAKDWAQTGRANAAAKGADIAHLSDDQVAAIHGYTTNEGYTQLNPALRGQTAMTPEVEAFATHLNEGLDRLPAHNGTTFRGHSPPASVLDEYRPGNSVFDAAPKSTAADGSKAFTGQLRETVQGQTGRDISAFSNYDEAEVLFKPGTRFEVLDRIDHPDGTTSAVLKEIVP